MNSRIRLICRVSIVSILLVWLFGDDLKDYLVRLRHRHINAEFSRRVEAVRESPTDKAVLEKLLEYYRTTSKTDGSWARAKFFTHLLPLVTPYQDNIKAGELFSTMLLPEISSCLKDDNEEVRFQAASAAGDFGFLSEPLVPHLVELIKKHPNDGSGMVAAIALSEIGPAARSALPELEKAAPYNQTARDAIEKLKKHNK